MNEAVKFVFLMIMGAVVAFLLYVLFFGTVSLDGTELAGTSTDQERTWFDGYTDTHNEGALMYASRAIETPISAYYYYYCYLPTLYSHYSMDVELSKDKSGQSTILDAINQDKINQTDSDLSNVSTEPYRLDIKGKVERYRYTTHFH